MFESNNENENNTASEDVVENNSEAKVGTANDSAEETVATEQEEIAEVTASEESEIAEEQAPVTSYRTLDGKEIISESATIINDKEYVAIRLSDGSVQTLTTAEYIERVVNTQQ